MTKARDRIRKGRRKLQAALPSPRVVERVRPIARIRDDHPSEDMVFAAGIVWEEARRAFLAWVDDFAVFGFGYALSEVLSDRVDACADDVVRGFCDERSASDFDFFVEDCSVGCIRLSDFAEETGGWSGYHCSQMDRYFGPAWDRVLSRCARAGLPWEDLGMFER